MLCICCCVGCFLVCFVLLGFFRFLGLFLVFSWFYVVCCSYRGLLLRVFYLIYWLYCCLLVCLMIVFGSGFT